MNRNANYFVICLSFLMTLSLVSCAKNSNGAGVIPTPKPKPTLNHEGNSFLIPLAGNAFITAPAAGYSETIHPRTGLSNWSSPNTVISSYVKLHKSGKIRVSVRAKALAAGENSTASLTINGKKASFQINTIENKDLMVGDFDVPAGYLKIDIQGLTKSGKSFGEISNIQLSGDATSQGLIYSDKPDFYYWARRGPSCHLGYQIPTNEDISYYYTEVIVPVGQDAQGSYFMATGFAEGYFGFQVNSPTERRILFSVWSPFETDDPSSIPDEQKILLNKKGKDVHIGEFGNEGSGGQSFLRFNWKAGNRYKFLLKGEPDGKGKTDYTAWFFSPETNDWKLIASFKRPMTNTYLKNFHSFLENFNPSYGFIERSANYQNQWVRSAKGTWHKISEAKFTVDNTYLNKQRLDAIGGSNQGGFFLKNCGFFNDYVAPNTKFNFNNTQKEPSIDLTKLP